MNEDWTEALDSKFARFLSDNVRPPNHPELLAALEDDDSPRRETRVLKDIIKQPGPDARETHGAMLRPMVVRRYSPASMSPAPCVHTSPASAFPYTPVGGPPVKVEYRRDAS